MRTNLARPLLVSLFLLCSMKTHGEEATPPASTGGINQELLANPSFEEWKEDQPIGWNSGERKNSTWRTASVMKDGTAHTGTAALGIPIPSENHFIVLSQRIPREKMMLGHTLSFSVWVKAPAKNEITLKLGFDRAKGDHRIAHTNSGKADWEQIDWRIEIPEDADLSSFKLDILRYGRSEELVLIDDASLMFVENTLD